MAGKLREARRQRATTVPSDARYHQVICRLLASAGSGIAEYRLATRRLPSDVEKPRGFRHIGAGDMRLSNGLTAPGAHIAIPLSPSRLFFAVLQDDEKAYREIRNRPPEILVKSVNERMALQARRYVYGRDESQLRFVAKRLGKMEAATPLG
jgi:hypothetical protein